MFDGCRPVAGRFPQSSPTSRDVRVIVFQDPCATLFSLQPQAALELLAGERRKARRGAKR